MNMQTDSLSQAFQNHRAPACTPCPSPDEIWEVVHGSASVEQRHAVIDHISKCSACAEDWRIAQRFPQDLSLDFVAAVPPTELQAANEAPSPPQSQSPFRRFVPAAALAAALLAAAIYIPWRQVDPSLDAPASTRRRGPVYRKADTGVTPLQQTFDPKSGFEWTAAASPEATYDVIILDASFREIHVVSGLRTNRLPFDAALRAKLKIGEFSWQVITKQPGGRQLQSAPKTELLAP